MTKHEAKRVRQRLSPNVSLPNSLVYTPVEDWSNDDVWLYLMQVKHPWDHDNKSLLGMYQGASEGGESVALGTEQSELAFAHLLAGGAIRLSPPLPPTPGGDR